MRILKLQIAAVSVVAIGACAVAETRGVDSKPIELSEAQAVTRSTNVGTAPMFTVSQLGTEAAAWVSAPGGGTDGRLYVSVAGADPAELRDSLGPIEAHGESPPKITYGPDGALNAIYVVGKVVPGRRFPLAALRYVRSEDAGRTWSAAATVTDDTSDFGSHNFHALHASKDGTLFVGWLDGRHGKSTAYIARSLDHGKSWDTNKPVEVAEACPCCRTALASRGDTVWIAWRKVFDGNVRDVVVSRSTDKGLTWGAPVRAHADNWVFPGCPHAGPSMQVDAKGRLHIAWWTGKEKSAGVYYARSDDGGVTFKTPVPLGVAEFSRASHVQLGLGEGDNVVAVWDDGTKKHPQVVMRISADGGKSFGAPQLVSSETRAAGFPVLTVAGKAVTIAWSEQSAEAHDHEVEVKSKRPKDAPKGLHAVGDAQVLVRRGSLE